MSNRILSVFLLCVLGLTSVGAEEAEDLAALLTLENVPRAKRISADEPLRKEFSPELAARYLDTASLNWVSKRNCATCHTTMSYLMVRPALDHVMENSGEVRDLFEAYLTERWDEGKKAPKNDYDPVVVGAALAFNDAQTTGTLSNVTRKTLDMMWTTQRDDGGWDWPKCNWAPMEVDDHFGVTLAALATGIAPDGYADTDAARAGMVKVRSYLEGHPSPSLHHRMMVAWASVRVDDLMSEAERGNTLEATLARQLPDGGWSTPSLLADWKTFKRKDGEPHAVDAADAYGTGLAIVLARELGIPAGDERLRKGVAWLKANQRESGKWFARSPSKDSRNYFSNCGSAYAVLALQACGNLPGWPFGHGDEKIEPAVKHE